MSTTINCKSRHELSQEKPFYFQWWMYIWSIIESIKTMGHSKKSRAFPKFQLNLIISKAILSANEILFPKTILI